MKRMIVGLAVATLFALSSFHTNPIYSYSPDSVAELAMPVSHAVIDPVVLVNVVPNESDALTAFLLKQPDREPMILAPDVTVQARFRRDYLDTSRSVAAIEPNLRGKNLVPCG